jgi:hypothetical protein
MPTRRGATTLSQWPMTSGERRSNLGSGAANPAFQKLSAEIAQQSAPNRGKWASIGYQAFKVPPRRATASVANTAEIRVARSSISATS